MHINCTPMLYPDAPCREYLATFTTPKFTFLWPRILSIYYRSCPNGKRKTHRRQCTPTSTSIIIKPFIYIYICCSRYIHSNSQSHPDMIRYHIVCYYPLYPHYKSPLKYVVIQLHPHISHYITIHISLPSDNLTQL